MKKTILIVLALLAVRLLPRALRRQARVLELLTLLIQVTADSLSVPPANTAKAVSTEQRVNALVSQGIGQQIAAYLQNPLTLGPLTVAGNLVVQGSVNCTSFAASGLLQANAGLTATTLSVAGHTVFNTSGDTTTSQGFLWANGGIRVSPGLSDWPITGGPYNANTVAALNQLYNALYG